MWLGGPVLGPILLLIYVNVFFKYMLPVFSVMYADEPNVIRSAKDPHELPQNTNMPLKKAFLVCKQ